MCYITDVTRKNKNREMENKNGISLLINQSPANKCQ